MEKKFIIISPEVLHAQNATRLVYAANKYNAETFIQTKHVAVNLKSIMGVLSLNIEKGQEFSVIINGIDEDDAMHEIYETIRSLKLAREI